MQNTIPFLELTWQERINCAFEALQQGKGVLLLDDKDRENECDVVFAADGLTPENMALLIRECSGIVCLVIGKQRADFLGLEMMVKNNESKFTTGFTVSIEAKKGITTGVSAVDRVQTIKVAIADDTKSEDLSKPGHVFPLVARDGGVMERRGHTEGSLDLVSLAGLKKAAVLCELMNPDGTMANLDDVLKFSKNHLMPIVHIQDIVEYIQSKK